MFSAFCSNLADHGFNLEGSYTFDYSHILDGGISSSAAARGLLDIGLTIDLNKLIGYEGAFFLDFQKLSGDNGSEDSGDIQGYSNIDEDPFELLYELWFETWFFDNRLRLKLGKVDANNEFAYVDNGGEFINSSMGNSPTIFVLPTYPDPAVSINVFIHPADNIYANFGVYDGSGVEGIKTGKRGLDNFINDGRGVFMIAELGSSWLARDNELSGRVGLGAWHLNGDFERFDGLEDSSSSGFYLVLDQTLWKENPQSGDDGKVINSFLQYGVAEEEVSEIENHFGAGLVLNRPFAKRNDDVLGVGASWVDLSDDSSLEFGKSSEIAVELFYKFQVGSNLSIKPDFQYIINPGGSSELNDATIASVRLALTF